MSFENGWHDVEIVETCPYCECENGIPYINPDRIDWQIRCENCGRKIILCSQCEDSNTNCDWHMQHGRSVCHMTSKRNRIRN